MFRVIDCAITERYYIAHAKGSGSERLLVTGNEVRSVIGTSFLLPQPIHLRGHTTSTISVMLGKDALGNRWDSISICVRLWTICSSRLTRLLSIIRSYLSLRYRWNRIAGRTSIESTSCRYIDIASLPLILRSYLETSPSHLRSLLVSSPFHRTSKPRRVRRPGYIALVFKYFPLTLH